jgi:hypothetical protein
VRAHRNGKLKELRAMAKAADFPPGMMMQCEAIRHLCPHLEAQIIEGKVKVEDTRVEVWAAFLRLIEDAEIRH